MNAPALVQGTLRTHSRSRQIESSRVVAGSPLYSAVLVRTATPVLQCLISRTALLYMMGRPLHRAATRRMLPPACRAPLLDYRLEALAAIEGIQIDAGQSAHTESLCSCNQH